MNDENQPGESLEEPPLADPPYDPKRFGPMIRRRRTARKWSQRKLAHELSISHSYVSQLERGRLVEITLSFLRRIATVFNMTFDDLLEEGGVNQSVLSGMEQRQAEEVRILSSEAAGLTLSQIRQLIGFARVMKEGTAQDAGAEPLEESPAGDESDAESLNHGEDLLVR